MTIEIARALGDLTNQMNELGRRIDNITRMYNEQRQSDIDYIAMETGVDLDQPEERTF